VAIPKDVVEIDKAVGLKFPWLPNAVPVSPELCSPYRTLGQNAPILNCLGAVPKFVPK